MTSSLNLRPGSILKETVTSTDHGVNEHELSPGSSVFYFLVTDTYSKGESWLFPNFTHAVINAISPNVDETGTIMCLEALNPDEEIAHNSTVLVAPILTSDCDEHSAREATYQFEVVPRDADELVGLFFKTSPGFFQPVLDIIDQFANKAV